VSDHPKLRPRGMRLLELYMRRGFDPNRMDPTHILHANPEELARELVRLQQTDPLYATLCRVQQDNPQVTDSHILASVLLSREELVEMLEQAVRDRPPQPMRVVIERDARQHERPVECADLLEPGVIGRELSDFLNSHTSCSGGALGRGTPVPVESPTYRPLSDLVYRPEEPDDDEE